MRRFPCQIQREKTDKSTSKVPTCLTDLPGRHDQGSSSPVLGTMDEACRALQICKLLPRHQLHECSVWHPARAQEHGTYSHNHSLIYDSLFAKECTWRLPNGHHHSIVTERPAWGLKNPSKSKVCYLDTSMLMWTRIFTHDKNIGWLQYLHGWGKARC